MAHLVLTFAKYHGTVSDDNSLCQMSSMLMWQIFSDAFPASPTHCIPIVCATVNDHLWQWVTMNGQLCKFPTATVTAIASTMYPVVCRKGRGRSSLSTESVNRGGHPIQKCLLKVTIDEGHIINEFLISCPRASTCHIECTANKKQEMYELPPVISTWCRESCRGVYQDMGCWLTTSYPFS